MVCTSSILDIGSRVNFNYSDNDSSLYPFKGYAIMSNFIAVSVFLTGKGDNITFQPGKRIESPMQSATVYSSTLRRYFCGYFFKRISISLSFLGNIVLHMVSLVNEMRLSVCIIFWIFRKPFSQKRWPCLADICRQLGLEPAYSRERLNVDGIGRECELLLGDGAAWAAYASGAAS